MRISDWSSDVCSSVLMPRPMNPIFAMPFRSFRLSLCGLFRRGAGGEVGAQPAEAPGGAGLGLVLAADPALVAHAVDGVEQEGVVDLAAARLVAAGIVGELHVRDLAEVLLDGACQVALHHLHVIEDRKSTRLNSSH